MIRRSMQHIFFFAAMKCLDGNAYSPNEQYLVIKY
jgi:hypothetical protein